MALPIKLFKNPKCFIKKLIWHSVKTIKIPKSLGKSKRYIMKIGEKMRKNFPLKNELSPMMIHPVKPNANINPLLLRCALPCNIVQYFDDRF